MLRRLVLSLTTVLAFASPAAAIGAPTVPQNVLTVAEEHWQPWVRQWCPAGEDIRIARGGTLRENGRPAWASAAIGDPQCRITIDADLLHNRRRLCVVLAHEIGHLLGHEHSTTGLMRSRPWMRDELCRVFSPSS